RAVGSWRAGGRVGGGGPAGSRSAPQARGSALDLVAVALQHRPPELDQVAVAPPMTAEGELRAVERERPLRRHLEREGDRLLELGYIERRDRRRAECPELVLVSAPQLGDIGHLGEQLQRRRDPPQREAAVADDVVARLGGPRVPGLREPVAIDPGRADVVVAARTPVGELVAEDEPVELVDEDELVRGEGLVEAG